MEQSSDYYLVSRSLLLAYEVDREAYRQTFKDSQKYIYVDSALTRETLFVHVLFQKRLRISVALGIALMEVFKQSVHINIRMSGR